MTNIFAYTALNSPYPGYVSINRDANGDVVVSVRAAPTKRMGVRVCGHECNPGGPGCNNYCNMHPDKSLPMADHPEPYEHTFEGAYASFTVPADEWAKIAATTQGEEP